MSEESLCEEACFALRSKLAVAMSLNHLACIGIVRSGTIASVEQVFPTPQAGKTALNANQLMYRPRPAGVKASESASQNRPSAAENGWFDRNQFLLLGIGLAQA
jgi:hypothetical protein